MIPAIVLLLFYLFILILIITKIFRKSKFEKKESNENEKLKKLLGCEKYQSNECYFFILKEEFKTQYEIDLLIKKLQNEVKQENKKFITFLIDLTIQYKKFLILDDDLFSLFKFNHNPLIRYDIKNYNPFISKYLDISSLLSEKILQQELSIINYKITTDEFVNLFYSKQFQNYQEIVSHKNESVTLTNNKILYNLDLPNIYDQIEHYPILKFPKTNNIIKLPITGKIGRIGKSELSFVKLIKNNLPEQFEVSVNKVLVCKNHIVYEPDIVVFSEKFNLYIDIEIDEPYEGLNNVDERKPIHYIDIDCNRNLSFTRRGWVVLRFSEKQIVLEPENCYNFLAELLYRLTQEKISYKLDFPNSEPRWSYEDAIEMSKNFFRENYLGIRPGGFNSFEPTKNQINISDKKGDEIEKFIHETPIYLTRKDIESRNNNSIDNYRIIQKTINENKFLKISTKNMSDVVQPKRMDQNCFLAYSYVFNQDRTYNFLEVYPIEIKDNYYTERIEFNGYNVRDIQNFLKKRQHKSCFLRMEYESYSDQGGRYIWYPIDNNYSNLIENAGKLTIRTITDVTCINNYDFNDLEFIKAFCFNRNQERTFKVSEDRVKWIEELDIDINRTDKTEYLDDLPF